MRPAQGARRLFSLVPEIDTCAQAGLDRAMMTRIMIAVFALGTLLSACTNWPYTADNAQAVYLVRHAEKEPGRDPALTPDGRIRAEALAARLDGARIEVIYSTDLARTRQTAAPFALKAGLPIVYYDPAALGALAEQVKADGRNTLVVGHSNTTPDLAAAFGGEAGAPIVEATEYDRLYVLTIKAGAVSTDIQRFGAVTAR